MNGSLISPQVVYSNYLTVWQSRRGEEVAWAHLWKTLGGAVRSITNIYSLLRSDPLRIYKKCYGNVRDSAETDLTKTAFIQTIPFNSTQTAMSRTAPRHPYPRQLQTALAKTAVRRQCPGQPWDSPTTVEQQLRQQYPGQRRDTPLKIQAHILLN